MFKQQQESQWKYSGRDVGKYRTKAVECLNIKNKVPKGKGMDFNTCEKQRVLLKL
ncbi:hypothetical protein DPMN_010366 [Dreissena polymorpha]|uniref:Uncharacterized protein n=1 Tax=Dreissena polymorpha TaxID=45954 RepID=A0A9D4N268_DREPO|nr:hypothetical protein DPMN_010366 [Dreissena polymorpha]